MRVSEYFGLQKTQPHLDFVDVTLHTDVPVFVDPTGIRTMRSQWSQECASLLQKYFKLILECIKRGEDDHARWLISSLNERNEFHIGFSKGASRGHAWGTESANWVWEAIRASKAAETGMLADLEDAVLTIEGIGKDMISDAVCNIIRGPLIRYTHDMCQYYGIPLENEVPSGPVWNPANGEWEDRLIPLPITRTHGPLVLIPKLIVRHQITFDAEKYYRHFLMPIMQQDEIDLGTNLVYLLKDKTPHVTKKALYEKYGSDKLAIVRETRPRIDILEQYRKIKRANPSKPLEHEDLAEIENTDKPDWDQLLLRLDEIEPGKEQANDYELLIEDILSALFYQSLCHPVRHEEIYDGRKVVDIRFANEARYGVFSWLALNWPAAFVVVECKNYGSEIGNPELDQLTGRFSPSSGKVGILVCRTVDDRAKMDKRCADAFVSDRGVIIVLDDLDIKQMIADVRGPEFDGPQKHPLLWKRFRDLTTK